MPLTTRSEFLPKWIAWEITQRCNLSCIHCRCRSDETGEVGLFTTEKAKALIDQISDWVQPVVVLSGGEPLLRKDIFEIASYGTKAGLRMCMATNGILVNDDVCEAIKSAGIKMVALSLDGPNAEVHDQFRRVHGAFEGVVSAARKFKQHSIPFLINSSFTERNKDYIADTFRLAKELSAQAWYMFMIVPIGRGEDILSELIKQPEYDEILEWHYNQEKNEDEILMRPTCAPHYFRLVKQFSKKDKSGYKPRDLKFATGAQKGCVAGQTICLIDAFGNVRPCSYLETVAGNVFQTPFREIWERSEVMISLRDFNSYRGRCGVCEYRFVCGGCRARAYAIKGDFLDEEPFCDYIPKKVSATHRL